MSKTPQTTWPTHKAKARKRRRNTPQRPAQRPEPMEDRREVAPHGRGA